MLPFISFSQTQLELGAKGKAQTLDSTGVGEARPKPIAHHLRAVLGAVVTSYLYRMCVCVCRAGTRCVRYPFATCLVLTQSRATRARVIRKTQTIMPAICEVGGGGLFLPLHDSEQLMPLSLRAIAYSCALSLILLASFRLAKILLAALAVVTDRTYYSDRERVPQRENTAIIGVFVIACGIQIPTTLLGVIELVSNNYHVQGLGPSSVVDAGAFGMLAIGAASVLAVPAGQTLALVGTTGAGNAPADEAATHSLPEAQAGAQAWAPARGRSLPTARSWQGCSRSARRTR